jgi:CubicO group peptidase (beta-lactamase class C family)
MIKTSLFVSLIFSSVLWASPMTKLLDHLVQKENKDVNTESFTLYRDGQVVFEKYWDVSDNDKHILWSMSKTVTAMIFGIAESEGYISRHDKVSKFYPGLYRERTNDEKKFFEEMTLEDLLTMSSGFDWNEYYESAPFASHVVRMLYVFAKGDTANYVLQTPLRYPPGTRFHYSSGDTNVIMDILKRSLPASTYEYYPWEKFFNPLEIDAVFEKDGSGTFMGASYVYMKTKDLIKLGQLILNKGKYKDKQVVPAEFIQKMITRAKSFDQNCKEDKYTYGYQIWLNRPCPGSQKRKIPGAPENLVMFFGHLGQLIFVYPDQNAVAVRFAHDKQKAFDRVKYGELLYDVLKEGKYE